MFVLTDLTKSGFQQIRNDRKLIAAKIKHYQALMDEFDAVIPFLEAIYEPNINIDFKENINNYVANVSIPFQGEEIHITCKLGEKNKFISVDDPELLKKAKSKIDIRIAEMFPLHFQK